MAITSKVKQFLVHRVLMPLGVLDRYVLMQKLDHGWQQRIRDVIECPDNLKIPRHPRAGVVKRGMQIMHNGLKVGVGSYYGNGVVQMLHQNKGVHEPQEEYVFEKVIEGMKPGSVMLELGAYWSFYSLCFFKKIPGAKCFMIEPEAANMEFGKRNFKLNDAQGTFYNAFIGEQSNFPEGQTPTICVDDFVEGNQIEFIDILHSDIQGFELEMLKGARKLINNKKVGYLFISTHGNELHYACLEFLKSNDFEVLCSADENDTYSLDGLIVAKAKYYPGLSAIDISLKSSH